MTAALWFAIGGILGIIAGCSFAVWLVIELENDETLYEDEWLD
jgi:hypothetical protein